VAGQAAEQRKIVAHGIRRGFGWQGEFQPRRGERFDRWFSAAPSGAWIICERLTHGCTVGYFLPRLRRSGRAALLRRREIGAVGHHRPTNCQVAVCKDPHAAGRSPKSAADGHTANGGPAAGSGEWRGKLRSSDQSYPEGIKSFSPVLVRWRAVRKHLRRDIAENRFNPVRVECFVWTTSQGSSSPVRLGPTLG